MSAIEFLRLITVLALVSSQALAIGEPAEKAAPPAPPVVTNEDIRQARDRHRQPSDEEVSKARAATGPRIDKLPQPATVAPLDLGAVSNGFASLAPDAALPRRSGPSLLVFISFSMPETTLLRLVEQASRTRATLVLRGLVGRSLVQTAARVQALIGPRRAAIQIDPQAFDRYGVTQTPTFVLLRDVASQACDTGQCAPQDDHAKVAGDVSLDYALRHIQRSSLRFAKDAATLLQRPAH